MKKYKVAVIALLALFALSAAGCLFSFVFASLQDMSWQNRREKLAFYRAQEEEFRKTGADYAEWKRLPDDLRAFRRDHIISMDDFAVFRRELNLCLDDNGFRATNIAFQFGPSQNRMRRVSLHFTLTGSYRDLKKFIFDMEQKPRMHFFERIELNGSGDKVTGSFGMEAYLAE
jgi:Tfp pilus assembly protein PilO